MNKSNYLKNKILEHVLRNTSYTSPTTVYLALYTTNPTAADSGTEVTGGSYSRKSMTFGAASSGTIAISSGISFTAMPAATIGWVGICDASSGGNLLYFVPLNSSITTTSGGDVEFAIGSITVSEA